MANVMLPKQIDLIQLANKRKILKGELNLFEMNRLMELISADRSGYVKIELNFGRDELGYAYVCGSIKANFRVICQRCDMPMSLLLNIKVNASPVYTEKEAEQLPQKYDPVLLTEDTISLLTMVEDEILLSIPIVPKHPKTECKIKSSDFIEWQDEKDKNYPFQDLKKLLRG